MKPRPVMTGRRDSIKSWAYPIPLDTGERSHTSTLFLPEAGMDQTGDISAILSKLFGFGLFLLPNLNNSRQLLILLILYICTASQKWHDLSGYCQILHPKKGLKNFLLVLAEVTRT